MFNLCIVFLILGNILTKRKEGWLLMDPKIQSKHKLKKHTKEIIEIKKESKMIQFANKKVKFNYSSN